MTKCKKHPKYGGKQRPRVSDCTVCWKIWTERQDQPPVEKVIDIMEALRSALAIAKKHSGVAQMVEQVSCKDEVTGSMPVAGATL